MTASDTARRQRILDAVLDISISTGFDSITIRGVAERAGVSTGLVMYHFKSRNDLIAAAGVHALQLYRDRVDEIVGDYTGIHRIRTHFDVLYGHPIPDAPPWTYWLEYWVHSSRDKEISERHLNRMEGRRELLASNIAAGIEEGDVRPKLDPLLAADLLRAIDAGLPVLLAMEPTIISEERAFAITQLALSLMEPADKRPP